MDVVQKLWQYKTGDPEYHFELAQHRGDISRRIVPAP